MEETDKQEPTLSDHSELPEVPDQTPGPDANMPAVQNDTKVEVKDETDVPLSATTGHPTDGDHGRRMIFGFNGAGSQGAVIDHGAKRAPNTPGLIEAFGVRFKGVESNFFDAVTETKVFQTLREAEQWVRSFVHSHATTDTEKSNG